MELQQLIKEARQRYKEGSKEQQQILNIVFGKDTFQPQDVKERIKTVEDAFDELPAEQLIELTGCSSYSDFQDETSNMPEHIKGFATACVIAVALNEGWTPDWDNNKEYKYYPWFYMSSSPGFSLLAHVFDGSYSFVGSRLCFKSNDLARYAGKQFVDVYKSFFQLNTSK